MELHHGACGVNAAHKVQYVHGNVFAATHTKYISRIAVEQSVTHGCWGFAVVRCTIQDNSAAVAVGIVTAPGNARGLPDWLTRSVQESVAVLSEF